MSLHLRRNKLALIAFLFGVVYAAVANTEELPHTVLLDKLDNPTGVAIQPGTGTVFVVESGAQRIVQLVASDQDETEKPFRPEPVVIGFPKDTYGKGPTYNIGPLSIEFLDKSTLIIGGGGNPDGSEVIYVASLPEEDQAAPNAKALLRFEPLAAIEAADNKPAVPGEGNFFNIVQIDNHVFATSNGDDEKGWIARGTLKDKKPGGALERFIATKPAAKVNAPVAMTKTPRNNLLVGQMGAITEEADSVITFFNAKNGKSLMSLKTDLHDIIALKYGPLKDPYRKSHLYALDYAWAKPEQGRLVRLDARLDDGGKQQVETIKLAALTHPTAMAFGPNGELYVTMLSTPGNENQADGKLIKFEPGL